MNITPVSRIVTPARSHPSHSPGWRTPVVGLLIGLLACSWSVRAQTAPAQPSPPPTVSSQKDAEEAVLLSPFEVKAEADKSYGALNSNSVTAFSTELKRMPVSADVFGEAFMNDVGLNTVEQLVQQFSAGAGMASISPDGSAPNSQYLDRNANGSLSLRGLVKKT